jgi:hypothetical protein
VVEARKFDLNIAWEDGKSLSTRCGGYNFSDLAEKWKSNLATALCPTPRRSSSLCHRTRYVRAARLAQEEEGCCTRNLIHTLDRISERPPQLAVFLFVLFAAVREAVLGP